jgi:hypothetical protein
MINVCVGVAVLQRQSAPMSPAVGSLQQLPQVRGGHVAFSWVVNVGGATVGGVVSSAAVRP